MELLPHNQKACEAVIAHLESSNRTCVVHPAGTGKSYIALQLIEDNSDARILYIDDLDGVFMIRPTEFVTVEGNGRAWSNAYISGSGIDVGADIFRRGL